MDRAPLTLSTHFCFVTPTPTTTLEERNVTGTGGRKGMTVTVTPHTKKSPTRERERERETHHHRGTKLFSFFFIDSIDPTLRVNSTTPWSLSSLYILYIYISSRLLRSSLSSPSYVIRSPKDAPYPLFYYVTRSFRI